MEKQKYTASYSSPPVHGTELLPFQRRTKYRIAGFCLEGGQRIYGVGKLKLAGLHPNFNYVLTFEITFKSWHRKKRSKQWSEATGQRFSDFLSKIVSFIRQCGKLY